MSIRQRHAFNISDLDRAVALRIYVDDPFWKDVSERWFADVSYTTSPDCLFWVYVFYMSYEVSANTGLSIPGPSERRLRRL
jgi:hypothetical protein